MPIRLHTWVYDDMDPSSLDVVAQSPPPKFSYEERHCSRCAVRGYGETKAVPRGMVTP